MATGNQGIREFPVAIVSKQNVQDLSMGSISHPEYIQNPLLSRKFLDELWTAALIGSVCSSSTFHG
jgi:hypothetical protein